MQTKDFRKQNCRGWSFKGLDLTGADFSDSDVRGADFSGADLTAAKFCRAKMGRTRKANNYDQLETQFMLSILVGVFAAIGNSFLTLFAKELLKTLSIESDANLLIAMLTYSLLFAIVTVNSKRIDLEYLLGLFITIITLALVLSLAVAGSVAKDSGGLGGIVFNVLARAGAGDNVNAATIASFGIVGGSIAIAIVGAGIVSRYIIGGFGLFLGLCGGLAAFRHPAGGFETVLINLTINIILGIYLGWRASKREESELLWLRGLSLKLACIDGTEFAFATLKDVDFSEADLKYARFNNATIINCCFQQAQNLYLALTNDTPLALRKVRDLIVDGISTDNNFAGLDLNGLDFSGLNLQGLNFSHANLCAANLSHTQMTGATLEGWNIDTETRLDDIDCRYYYYLENGEKKRMPPEGEEYKTGEFTRIFQKIANTIDFIAHNEMELAAIKLSVEQVRVESDNDDIRVQAIEEKDGFIVVKVNVPKTEDRGILYHEVNSLKQEFETKIQLLMTENQAKLGGLQGNIEILKDQLREQRQALLAAIQPIYHYGDNVQEKIQEKKVAEINQHSNGSSKLTPELEELYQVLEEIDGGKKSFKPNGEGIEELKKFQSTIRCLKEAESRGYIGKVSCPSPSKGTESYGMIFVAVIVESLTFKAYEVLRNPEKLIISNHPQASIDMSTQNVNITGSTISGILNLGEINGNVSQTIQQLPAEQNDLKALLSQLQTLINTSPLTDTAKQKALSKTQDIAEATKQPKEDQQNIVQKTLGYFDGLADSLENIPETATKLGTTVAAIASLFGL